MPNRNVLTVMLAVVAWLACYSQATRLRYAGILSHAIADVADYYVEPVDSRDVFEHAMHGIADGLDENSAYIAPDQFTRLREDLDQEFVGVGVQVTMDPETEHLTVLSPLFDSPAYRAGIRAGDLIVAIDGTDTAGLDIGQSVKLIKGLPGTRVDLKILPYGQQKMRHVQLQRQRISVASLLGDTRNPDGSWNFTLKDQPRIGYIRINNFGENTAEEFVAVYRELEGSIDGLILDVRNNPGGLLTAALQLCDMFVSDGIILTVRGRGGEIDQAFHAHDDETIVDSKLPIAVLVNGISASASEILAACLQDYQRATIVGQRSWGKGTVQRVFELEGGRSALKFTTATFWRPSGVNIHRSTRSREEDDLSGAWGVQPRPEYRVPLDMQEQQQWYLWRQRRDAVQLEDLSGSSQHAPPPHPEDAEDSMLDRAAEPEAEAANAVTNQQLEVPDDFHDRQLERAIDAVRGRSS